MTDKMKNPRNTRDIQENSLVNFMAAIGYEPVYDHRGIAAFYQPKFARTGEARISVNRAIKMHNEDAENAFRSIVNRGKYAAVEGLRDYLRKSDKNIDEVVSLFAGTCKIVQFVNANFSKKKGLVITKHQVKFMTKYDERLYGFHK